MNRIVATFFRCVVVLFGLGVLVFMLWEPHLEGRNAHATNFEIYFGDPFLAYAYVASIPIFAALFRAFEWVGYSGRNEAFSAPARNAMKSVKRCGISLIVFVVGGLLIILLQESDDRAGGVMIGLLAVLVSVMITAMSMFFERTFRNEPDFESAA
jgi:hypothetical protein